MDIKGTIIFTETGFVLTPTNGDVEVYQKSETVGSQYAVLDGLKYKWVNQPKKVDTIEISDEEDSDEEE